MYEPLPPTLAELVTHAEKFGTAEVFETAELYLAMPELIQLGTELERIDTERRKRFGPQPKRRKLSREQKLRAVAFLAKEGTPPARIAKHLGISPTHARRLMREAETSLADAQEAA
jgi:transposase